MGVKNMYLMLGGGGPKFTSRKCRKIEFYVPKVGIFQSFLDILKVFLEQTKTP